MRLLHQVSVLLVYLLVSNESAGGFKCTPSTCGQLKDIRYPFRLKDDHINCGDPRYELTCEANRTILNYHSGKYYVQSISYVNKTIQITDVRLASGYCSLPSHNLSPHTIDGDQFLGTQHQLLAGQRGVPSINYWIPTELSNAAVYDDPLPQYYYGAVSFVNCTQKIQSKSYIPYIPIPCLSRDGGFVYVVYDTIIDSLWPSCRFLAMVPMVPRMDDGLTQSEAQIFDSLQRGIFLSWINPECRSVSSVIKDCLGGGWGLTSALRYVLGRKRWSVSPVIEYEFSPREESFLVCLDLAFPTNCIIEYATVQLVITLIVLLGSVLRISFIVRFVCVPLIVYAFLTYMYWKTRVRIDTVEKFLRNQQSLTPTRYTYTEIIVMTRNFKDKLGQGGFGSVYKGVLLSGFQVAVKVLGNSKCNGDDFISEVSTIGRINHINVVRLIGYSSEGSKRALVYEYLPKGSLDKHIFSSNATIQRPFTWDKLIDIALGVARGIDYLHQGCDMRILHFDIKPHNILLDNSFNPKISDFGLAKLFPKDFSMVALSVARGTIGYIAPELISRSFGIISCKSDVYSFGMLLLEMAGGRRNVEPKVKNSSQYYYPSWIYGQLNDQKVEAYDIVDDVILVGEVERKLSIVGLWCIQTRPSDRPSVTRVIEMLQAAVDTLQMPPKPFMSAERASSIHTRDISVQSSSTALSLISEIESLN